MSFLTNAQLWNACRNADQSFKASTAEATDAFFTAKGFEAIANKDYRILDNFYSLSMRVHLQAVVMANVKDILSQQDFGEDYAGDIGGAIQQRMYQGILYCVDPKWIDLEDGDTIDESEVRKGLPEEDFWTMNEQLANRVTVPDRFMFKNLFTQEYGMDTLITGQAKSIMEGFKLQRTIDTEEGIHNALISENHPMQDTQKYETADITDAESAINFVKLVRDLVDAMVWSKTGADGKFNAGEFANAIDKDNLRLLARPELFNKLATISRLNSPEDMSLPIKVVRVETFGGVAPILTASETYKAGKVSVSNDAAPSYTNYKHATINADIATIASNISEATETPIYKSDGERVGTAYYLSTGIVTVSSTTYTTIYVPKKSAHYYDPHENEMALIADKGVIFRTELNPVTVEPHRVPRGRYTNLELASPDNGIGYDHRKTLVSISKAE